jgi:FHS family L-fucose permease-like MFS transporter
LAEEIDEVGITDGQGPFWQQYRCIFGFVAQTPYIYHSGAQVTVASFAVNFLLDQGVGID